MKKTENGALGFETTNSCLLDMLYKVSSYRTADEETIKRDYFKALVENKKLAAKFAFYCGDIREGLGERRLFSIMFKSLLDYYPAQASNLVQYIPEYNRWKTVLDLLEDSVVARKYKLNYDTRCMIVDLIRKQLNQDIQSMRKMESMSLLAKWMPSLTASNDKQRQLAGWLRRNLGYAPKEYRKTLHALRVALDVTEVRTSKNEWGSIVYENVPSKANLKYEDAFLRHDFSRRKKYLEDVKTGKQKINSSVLFPHEIVKKYTNRYIYTDIKNDAVESMWNALPKPDAFNCLVVCDGSGSMYHDYLGVGVLSSTIAHALTLYFSQYLTEPFKNRFITFSRKPQLVDLSSCKTLNDKVRAISTYDEMATTNIESVFDVILKTAVDNNLKQTEIPENVMIFSDMEFDHATKYPNQALFEHIEEKFFKHGYSLPRLIFWNLGSRTNVVPITQNENGVVLISGFSTNLVSMIINNEVDPYQNLKKILLSKRYEPITLKDK